MQNQTGHNNKKWLKLSESLGTAPLSKCIWTKQIIEGVGEVEEETDVQELVKWDEKWEN